MHELHLTHDGPVSRFLEFAEDRTNLVGADDAETAEVSGRTTDASVGTR